MIYVSNPLTRYTGVFFVVVVIMLATNCSATSDWRCSGARSIEVELASVTLSGERDVTPHTLERSFVLLGKCPVSGYEVFVRDPKVFAKWLEGLDAYSRTATNLSVLRQFKEVVLRQGKKVNTKLADTILKHLEAVIPPHSVRPSRTSICELCQAALAASMSDSNVADGEFRRWLSDDLLFLLSLDPTTFYRAMSTNSALFQKWLTDMPDLSFAGLPENKGVSDLFRACLLDQLRSKATTQQFKSIRRKIILRLSSVSYRVID